MGAGRLPGTPRAHRGSFAARRRHRHRGARARPASVESARPAVRRREQARCGQHDRHRACRALERRRLYAAFVASTLALNSVLYKKVPYDPVRDFAPITLAATAPNVLLVNPSVPARSLAEFIALAKTRPGTLSYGTPGIGTSPHLSMELLKSLAGIDLQHVPYRGTAAAVTDLIGGQIAATFANALTA